jgi:hypothetical protein
MPVYAQSCRRAPTATVRDEVADNIRTVRPGLDVADDTPLDISTLQGAINEAQRTRALQTENAAKFLSSIGASGRHKFAGQNLSVQKGAGTLNGYITEKGLFKEWPNDTLMRKSSGKYGCPAVPATGPLRALPSGYGFPNTNDTSYVGAPFTKTPNSEASRDTVDVFVGSSMIGGGLSSNWDPSEKSLPACGNEGVNVQVVYPGKATGSTYAGTYNIGTAAITGYEYQEDMASPTYETCMARAEDKGASLFALTRNRCYINQKSRNLATSAGMGIEVKGRGAMSSNPGQKMLHFGMDGTLNILTSEDPNGQVIFKLGNDPIATCDKLNGGLMSGKNGTWGENCNGITRPYYRWAYLGRW